jgi:hypothetical protein
MSDGCSYAYADGLNAFYHGEIIGEAIYSGLLEGTTDHLELLKLGHLLQLETETKAWLRPHMISAGLSIAEPSALREVAARFVTEQSALDWSGKMKALVELIPDLAKQYSRYAEAARIRGDAQQAAVCNFMVEHELAQEKFARLELEGAELSASLAPLLHHSRYPLPIGVSPAAA